MNRLVLIVLLLLVFFIGLMNAQTVIQPTEDVFVITFGGGEGCNAFLKYEITSVPGGMSIDSVFLTPFVYEINSGWDGDVNYWNVNDQDWTESDSARLIWNLPTSDSTHQNSGFGTALGWARSIDLKNIFLTDYNAGNTFCSIKMKDHDDPTFMPQPGAFPIDDNDTLALGNRAFGQHIVFYPHEFPNAPPWLLVFYHDIGINEQNSEIALPSLEIYPNPCRQMTYIKFLTPNTKCQIKIYDSSGRLVKNLSVPSSYFLVPSKITWDGTDQADQKVPTGIYFCELDIGVQRVVKKICLIR
jgi:hypothetical protein